MLFNLYHLCQELLCCCTYFNLLQWQQQHVVNVTSRTFCSSIPLLFPTTSVLRNWSIIVTMRSRNDAYKTWIIQSSCWKSWRNLVNIGQQTAAGHTFVDCQSASYKPPCNAHPSLQSCLQPSWIFQMTFHLSGCGRYKCCKVEHWSTASIKMLWCRPKRQRCPLGWGRQHKASCGKNTSRQMTAG
jgi:hypothetical protein